MFTKNEIINIAIDDLGESGEGIGKIDNFTIFVHGGIPGDYLEAKIIKVKKQYAIAKATNIIEESSLRVDRPCPYLNCGGCQTQSIDYKAQLSLKKEIVSSSLQRIGGISTPVNDVIGMDEPMAYRNKSQFPVREINGELHIGFYKQRTHDVVDIESCMLQHPLINNIMKCLRSILKESGISAYNEFSNSGYLRHIVTRISYRTKDTMLIFVTNGSSSEDKMLNEIVDLLKKEFVEIKSFIQNINKSKGNRVLGFENITLDGHDQITDYIDDLSFQISPLSFLQVNPIQTEILYHTALDLLDLDHNDRVFDIYCGIGTISLFLAKKAKEVYGVEVVEVAVEDAKKNALRNNQINTEFFTGRAEDIIPKLYEEGYCADVVVVDPPRKGCDMEVLKTILEMAPKKIAYISCKASTLARDLKILSEKYEVEVVQPVDMFPYTTHVETVCLLKLLK